MVILERYLAFGLLGLCRVQGKCVRDGRVDSLVAWKALVTWCPVEMSESEVLAQSIAGGGGDIVDGDNWRRFRNTCLQSCTGF